MEEIRSALTSARSYVTMENNSVYYETENSDNMSICQDLKNLIEGNKLEEKKEEPQEFETKEEQSDYVQVKETVSEEVPPKKEEPLDDGVIVVTSDYIDSKKLDSNHLVPEMLSNKFPGHHDRNQESNTSLSSFGAANSPSYPDYALTPEITAFEQGIQPDPFDLEKKRSPSRSRSELQYTTEDVSMEDTKKRVPEEQDFVVIPEAVIPEDNEEEDYSRAVDFSENVPADVQNKRMVDPTSLKPLSKSAEPSEEFPPLKIRRRGPSQGSSLKARGQKRETEKREPITEVSIKPEAITEQKRTPHAADTKRDAATHQTEYVEPADPTNLKYSVSITPKREFAPSNSNSAHSSPQKKT
eukprot:UN22728